MKILSINNYHYRRGGAEVCYLDFNDILEQKGHSVINFSMRMAQNIPSQWENYFIGEIEYANLTAPGKLKNAAKIIYSFEAKKNLKKLLDDTRPEIAHLHNIYHHISPSVLDLLKSYNIPAVMTLHDLKLLCPSHSMLRQGRICELCKGGNFYNVFTHKCLKDSRPLSLLVAFETYLHKIWRIYEKNVDFFIVPSKFFKEKFIEYGFCENKILYVPNFVNTDEYSPDYTVGDYILFVGRLSGEKGIITLLSAMEKVKNVTLKIVGEGPERGALERIIRERNLNHVELLGHKSIAQLRDLYRGAKFVVLTSECYENAPLAVMEAFACGKPVIGSALGGIPELLDKGRNGFTFTAGQPQDLAEKITALASDPNLIVRMGENARSFLEKNFLPEKYYEDIMSVYQRMLKNI